MKKTVLILSMVFSFYAMDQAAASTITIGNVESLNKGNKEFYTFDLTIDDQNWEKLKAKKKGKGEITFTTHGGVNVTKQGQPTAFEKEFMDGQGKNATWAYRMDITLYETQSGDWDWYGTIQRWEKQPGQAKRHFSLVEQVKKPMHTPLPNAAWLLGAGLIGLLGIRKRFRGRR